jgi:predicted RNA-binding protein
MCESQVVIEGKPDIIEDVVRVVIGNGTVTCYKLIGEKITLDGKVKEIDLMNHKIIIEQ